MKHLIALLLTICLSTYISAQWTTERQGIWYSIDNGKASVVANPDGGSYYYETIIIPDTIDSYYPVTGIANRAFANSQNARRITLPAGLTSLGDDVFSGCSSLEWLTCKATTPPSCTYHTFDGLYSDITLSVPQGAANNYQNDWVWNRFSNIVDECIIRVDSAIGDNLVASWHCDNTMTISGFGPMVDNYNLMGSPLRYMKDDVVRLDVEDGVTSICYAACFDCKLEEVNLPSTITFIGDRAFAGNDKLKSVVMQPVAELYIDEYAFWNCSRLQRIVLPEGLDSIGRFAFSMCESLISAYLPACMSKIAPTAFYVCDALEKIAVAPNNPKYDSRNRCNAVVETETNKLILGCGKTVIPEEVTHIGEQAFYNCHSLRKINIPAAVDTIEAWAFCGCDGLDTIDCYAAVPPYLGSSNSLYEVRSSCVLIVNPGTKPQYESALYWKNLTIVERVDSDNSTPTPVFHNYVDLGLTSSLLWADCNIGASSPEQYGEYFAWGETHAKSRYDWDNYFDAYDEGTTMGYYNLIGGETQLIESDDAAHVLWGGNWRMPTYKEWQELVNECEWNSTTREGIDGAEVVGPNGNSIFLPYTGYYTDTLHEETAWGYYWSSTLCDYHPAGAMAMNVNKYYVSAGRYFGMSIRPVMPNHESSSTPVVTNRTDHLSGTAYDILGRPVDSSYHGIVIRNGEKFLQ